MSKATDSRCRTIVKALSWQLLGLFTTSAIGFIMTGSLAKAGSFAVVSAAIGFGCYIVHERIWIAIPWGRQAA